MESKSKILKKEIDELIKGVEEIELRFKLLTENPEGYLNKFFPDVSTSDLTTIMDVFAGEPLFFTNRAGECAHLINNCTQALHILPDETPDECRIRRSQFVFIASKLTQLISNFSDLQSQIEEALDGDPIALGIITNSIPDVLDNFDFIKTECDKIKKVFVF